jgi:Na+/H+ antiporter NhaC
MCANIVVNFDIRRGIKLDTNDIMVGVVGSSISPISDATVTAADSESAARNTHIQLPYSLVSFDLYKILGALILRF